MPSLLPLPFPLPFPPAAAAVAAAAAAAAAAATAVSLDGELGDRNGVAADSTRALAGGDDAAAPALRWPCGVLAAATAFALAAAAAAAAAASAPKAWVARS